MQAVKWICCHIKSKEKEIGLKWLRPRGVKRKIGDVTNRFMFVFLIKNKVGQA